MMSEVKKSLPVDVAICAAAVSDFKPINRSKNKIKTTVASYGSFFYKIAFRWYGDIHDYELQAKTTRHFGIDGKTGNAFPISFKIIKLFSD